MAILLIAVFTATLGVVLAASRVRAGGPTPASTRLQALAAGALSRPVSPAAGAEPLRPAAPSLGLSRRGQATGMQLALLRAGLKLRPVEYQAAAVASGLLFGVLGLRLPAPVVSAPVMALAGFLAPRLMLNCLQAGRVKRCEAQLADSLTLIASSLRSGYSFLRALQVVGQQMPDPIAQEFRRAVAESSLGLPTEQALGQMLARVPSYDLELIVTAVNIQIEVGGNLAEILETIAETIRERVRNQREIAALTAEGKLSGAICAGMPPVMFAFLWIFNPDYLRPLLQQTAGLYALGFAAALQIAGFLWTRALIRIDV